MSVILVERSPYSMFAKTPVYEVGGEIVHGLMQDVVVPDATDSTFTVRGAEGGRLDSISNMFYGTPSLWWVIARANNIQDPLLDIAQGTNLRIPSRTRLANDGVLDI